ncbi:MAG TPA: hypothetical protein VGM31_10400 [Puia sp.]|jgi:hypothetical protein
MHLLTVSFYEFGQFLRIVLWIFLPLFVIVLLVTTYIHHRRKGRETGLVLENEGLLLAGEPNGGSGTTPGSADVADIGQPEGDNLYKSLIWMKQKFEDYREQADQRMWTLKEQLDQRTAAVQQLVDELTQAKGKIVELSDKLENNMSLLMNIHKELDRSLNMEVAAPAAITPEAANGGPGTGE